MKCSKRMQWWLMHPQFHSTNFIEYQERVCTEIGTKDMTTIPAFEELKPASDSNSNRCWYNMRTLREA